MFLDILKLLPYQGRAKILQEILWLEILYSQGRKCGFKQLQRSWVFVIFWVVDSCWQVGWFMFLFFWVIGYRVDAKFHCWFNVGSSKLRWNCAEQLPRGMPTRRTSTGRRCGWCSASSNNLLTAVVAIKSSSESVQQCSTMRKVWYFRLSGRRHCWCGTTVFSCFLGALVERSLILTMMGGDKLRPFAWCRVVHSSECTAV